MSRFVTLPNGERRWGPYGAAGLLFVDLGAAVEPSYLLALRSARTHIGDVWGVPGGAIDEGESALAAAVREADEELGGVPEFVVIGEHVEDHGTWSYTTFVAAVGVSWRPTGLNWELDRALWLVAAEVERLRMHPGLAAAWPVLRKIAASATSAGR